MNFVSRAETRTRACYRQKDLRNTQKLQVWRRITEGGQLCNSKPTFLSWQNFIPNEGKPLQAPLEHALFQRIHKWICNFSAFCLACYPWTAGLLLGPKPASPPVWRPTETTAGGYVKAFAVLFPLLWSLTKHCLPTHSLCLSDRNSRNQTRWNCFTPFVKVIMPMVVYYV